MRNVCHFSCCTINCTIVTCQQRSANTNKHIKDIVCFSDISVFFSSHTTCCWVSEQHSRQLRCRSNRERWRQSKDQQTWGRSSFYCPSGKIVVLTTSSPDGNRNTTGLLSTCTKVLSTELHNHPSVRSCWTTDSVISYIPPSDFAVLKENNASSLFTFLSLSYSVHRKKKLTALPYKITSWEHFVPWGHGFEQSTVKEGINKCGLSIHDMHSSCLMVKYNPLPGGMVPRDGIHSRFSEPQELGQMNHCFIKILNIVQ